MYALTQKTERMYTFMIPLPMQLMSERVSWGEPEINLNIPRSNGELRHARLGHASEDIMRNAADMHPTFR